MNCIKNILFYSLTFLLSLTLTTQASAQVWLADAMSRARQDDPPKNITTLNLSAARNEWEPFQVIVRAQAQPTTVNDVSRSDFTGAKGKILAASNPMYRRYANALMEHKLTPGSPQDVEPVVDSKTGNVGFTAPVEGVGRTTSDAFRYYLNSRGLIALNLPLYQIWPWENPADPAVAVAVVNYLKQLYEFGKNQGWAERFYIYTLDEPEDQKDFQYIQALSKLIHEAKLKSLVTVEPSVDNGSLIGSVDIWVPHASSILKNPFNPETWIPYQLSEANGVIIQIYDSTGKVVKTLNLGYRLSGFYISRDKAAHWDGKNELGEPVASGV